MKSVNVAVTASPAVTKAPVVGIVGLGAIGLWLAGSLARAGVAVRALARPAIANALADAPLHLVDRTTGQQFQHRFAAGTLSTEPEILRQCDVVLVCVKSQHTAQVAAQIAPVVKAGTLLVSCQNGVGNVQALIQAFSQPGAKAIDTAPANVTVVAMMVPYNVLWPNATTVQKASGSQLVLDSRASALLSILRQAELAVTTADDMAAVLWGKLLLNLNNPLNALSGVPLLQQFQDRQWRRLLAQAIAEALHVLQHARQPLQSPLPLPLWLLPSVLALPNFLFTRLARKMLAIDPQARSSMWHDVQQGKDTEIAFINGAVCQLGKQLHIATPVNDDIVRQIEALAATKST